MDRFATSNPVENECTSLRDLTQYCGGDFAGLDSKLDYIKGMNFDAVMVSSIADQSPGLPFTWLSFNVHALDVRPPGLARNVESLGVFHQLTLQPYATIFKNNSRCAVHVKSE